MHLLSLFSFNPPFYEHKKTSLVDIMMMIDNQCESDRP